MSIALVKRSQVKLASGSVIVELERLGEARGISESGQTGMSEASFIPPITSNF